MKSFVAAACIAASIAASDVRDDVALFAEDGTQTKFFIIDSVLKDFFGLAEQERMEARENCFINDRDVWDQYVSAMNLIYEEGDYIRGYHRMY